MSDDIPSGWYPDAQGTIRWWDGDQWTDHVREPTSAEAAAQGTAVMAAADESAAAEPEPVAAESVAPVAETTITGTVAEAAAHPVKRTWEPEEDDYEDAEHAAKRRLWLTATVVGLLCLLLGYGIGSRGDESTPTAAVTTAPTSSPELEQLRADLDQRKSELDQREQALDQREQDLDASATPSPTPSPTESSSSDYLDDTIDNETVKVGTDVEAGRYQTDGADDTSFDCEYTVSRDEAGDDVIQDDSTKNSASVTLTDGQYFTSDNCKPWDKTS